MIDRILKLLALHTSLFLTPALKADFSFYSNLTADGFDLLEASQWQSLSEGFKKTPDVIELKDGQSLYVIGDIHGDIWNMLRILRKILAVDDQGMINPDFKDHTLFNGDLIHRGFHDRQVLEFMARLNAFGTHGAGHWLTIGNHDVDELMLNDVHRLDQFMSPKSADEFADLGSTSSKGRYAAFQPGGLFRRLYQQANVAVIAGKTVIVHAGLLPELVSQGRDSLSDMNQDFSEWISNTIDLPNFLRAEIITTYGNGRSGWGADLRYRLGGFVIPQIKRARQAALNKRNRFYNPIWTRWLAEYTDEVEVCQELQAVLTLLDVEYMVVGHTPQSDGVRTRCDGKLFLADTFISEGYDEEIGSGKLYVDPKRAQTRRLNVVRVSNNKAPEILNLEEPKS